MAYDPTKPADHSQIVAAELRSQFQSLFDFIEGGLGGKVDNTTLDETIANQTAGACLDVEPIPFTASDPPTQSEVQTVIDRFNELLNALKRGA